MGRSVAIFDMDGTLADSMYFWKRAPAWVLYGMGHLLTSADEIAFQSVGFEGIPAYLVETYHLPCTPAEFRSRIDSLMLERYRTDVLPWPDVPEYLRALSRRGIRSVILTASAPPFIQSFWSAFLWRPILKLLFLPRRWACPKATLPSTTFSFSSSTAVQRTVSCLRTPPMPSGRPHRPASPASASWTPARATATHS